MNLFFYGFIVVNPHSKKFDSLKNRQVFRDKLQNMDYSDIPDVFYKKTYEIFPEGLYGHIQIKPNKSDYDKDNIINTKISFPESHKLQKAKKIKELFADVGVNVEYDYMTLEERNKNISKRKFETAFIESGVNAQFPDAFFTFFYER